MNILGHCWIAVNSIAGRRDLLIIGSLLPESFPFISGNPFGVGEIHEGGEVFLKYLEQKCPKLKDLAIGMMSHSVKFGADGWNKSVEKFAASSRQGLLEEIAEASGIDLRIAEYRLHNFLWWGIDAWILRQYPDFVKEVKLAIETIDLKEVSSLLSGAFSKDRRAVTETLTTLFKKIYRPDDLDSVEGLTKIWSRQAAGLPEKDRIQVDKVTTIIQECATLLGDDWQNLVDLVTKETRNNLFQFELKGKEGNSLAKKEIEV